MIWALEDFGDDDFEKMQELKWKLNRCRKLKKRKESEGIQKRDSNKISVSFFKLIKLVNQLFTCNLKF
jgi:hypothetical protein